MSAPPKLTFESARALGDVWALTELWKELGFGEIRQVFGRTRHTTDIEALLRVMVFNRLCNPDSKLGVLRCLETVALPEVDLPTISHQQLLRAMDALVDRRDEVDAVIAGLSIYHEVFDGNTAETKTLLATRAKVLERFPAI